MLMSHLTFSVGRDLFTANQSEKHMFTVILKLRIYSCKHSLLYTSVLSISLSYARIYLRYALEQQTIIFTKTSSFTKGSQSIHILWLVIAARLSFLIFKAIAFSYVSHQPIEIELSALTFNTTVYSDSNRNSGI